jgi:hypothetical protein
MSSHILYLIGFITFLYIATISLYLCSIYINGKDDVLKDFLCRATSSNKEDCVSFILEKSCFAFIYTFILPLSGILFLSVLMFAKVGLLEYCLVVFLFLLVTFMTLFFFSDYFFSMLVICGNNICIRCAATRFRTISGTIGKGLRYEDVKSGLFKFYSTHYSINIIIGSRGFVVLNTGNKKALCRVLDKIIQAIHMGGE